MRKDLMSKVLKEDMIISTRLSSSNIWIQNIVYKVENHMVTIGLLSEYLENIIMLGQNMTLKVSNPKTEFLFEGEIVKITPDFPSCVTLKIRDIKKLKNIRTFPRYDVYLGAVIKPSDSDEEYFAIVHNISLVGMAFYSRDDFKIGDQSFEFSVYLPDSKTVKATGKVTRVSLKEHFSDYGFQYTQTNGESNTLLPDFFNSIEDEKDKLREEFLTYVKKHL
ncbi:MAG: PilZ domain-containing protein [Clostridium sp.]|nr:PilZ domain-containing protein [Clostridium sp.]